MKKNIAVQKIENKKHYHSKDVAYAFEQTLSSENGLTTDEAKSRLAKYGENVLPQGKPKSVFMIFLLELINPIVLLLLVAMGFSFIVKEILDAFVILGIVLIDAITGTVQEKRAETIARSLSAMIKQKCKALRDGEKVEIDSKNIVIGDIVFVESGDRIPADMRIVECYNLSIDEAMLTGESINSEKSMQESADNALLGDKKNMLFAGTSVITGRAKCVVVSTGADTEIGSIASGISSVKDEKSPLDIRIKKFSKQITIAVAVVAVVLIALLFIQGNPANEIFLSVIALSVSAIPEGLPLAVTVSLSIASNRMAKKNVVVKKLNAVESLGSCTVIATDKTGTLTLNEQTAKKILLPNGTSFDISGSGYNDNGEVLCSDENAIAYAKDIGLVSTLNNEAKLYKHNNTFTHIGDSIDVAFLALGKKLGITTTGQHILSSIPYESENKYSGVFYENETGIFMSVKGSLETVMSFCSEMKVGDNYVPLDKDMLTKQNEKLAKDGYRVIAIANGKTRKQEKYDSTDLHDLKFLGLVAFIDPVREDAKQAIAECKTAGIKVVMITGDHPLTAFAIAKDISIAKTQTEVANGEEVAKMFALGVVAFDNFVKSKTVFSRVTPTDKLHIVEAMKRNGEFVAVTGDGVNDAPAIKCAHIGIAMGSGTDVAKETADMIITDDKFSSIVAGIKEGRNAYSNIRKVTYLLLSSAFAEILFFVVSIAMSLPLPLVAIQLLWLNIITDGLQDLALAFEPAEKTIMNEKPRPTNESLFSKSLLKECGLSGFWMASLVFGLWILSLKVFNFNLVYARSLSMALMVFLQNFQALNCRSETESLFKIPAFSNKFFFASILGASILQLMFMEIDGLSHLLDLTNVSYIHLLYILLASATIIAIMEVYKAIQKRRRKKTNA